MMTQGYVRPARMEDVPCLAADLREADVAEIKASSGKNPEDALRTGVASGYAHVACLPDGTPAAIFGVNPVAVGTGAVWMLATNQFKSLHRQFLRECQGVLHEISKGYDLLFNLTDARNPVHHRWIKWMGFTFIKLHESYGHEGREFLEFVRITGDEHV